MNNSQFDIANSDLSTEEKIKLAATKVFTEKGYSATKTRDIAEVAGINIASLHYYFRNKENLYRIVATEALKKFSAIHERAFWTEGELKEQIRQHVTDYIDFFKENPFLPTFIVAETQKSPEQLENMVRFRTTNERLQKILEKNIESGIIRPISLGHFIANLVGLTIMPFLSRGLMKHAAGVNDEEFAQMLEERKTMIPNMVIKDLYIEKEVD
ncbi:MAG: TetR/AcrR family transcriptional regulator [Bacteroidota bacterium]